LRRLSYNKLECDSEEGMSINESSPDDEVHETHDRGEILETTPHASARDVFLLNEICRPLVARSFDVIGRNR
jgi:hypothetical protein